MIRRAAAIVLALVLNPALVRAQELVLTVSVPSADVHKGPSTATPVIGHASRDTVLPVSNNLGSWVRIPWPDAQDGIGYVHVTMGRVGPPAVKSPEVNRTSAAPAATPAVAAPASAPASTPAPAATRASTDRRIATRSQLNPPPALHTLGVGGLIGSTHTFGATARAWHDNHLGIQLGFSRESMTSDVAAGRVTTVQFEPGVVYGFVDRVTDYVWIRPYAGSVVTFGSQSMSTTATPVITEPASNGGVGFRVFGGSEFMFASAPRFGLSADVGYRHFPTTFPGFESNPLSVSIAGHWYVK